MRHCSAHVARIVTVTVNVPVAIGVGREPDAVNVEIGVGIVRERIRRIGLFVVPRPNVVGDEPCQCEPLFDFDNASLSLPERRQSNDAPFCSEPGTSTDSCLVGAPIGNSERQGRGNTS